MSPTRRTSPFHRGRKLRLAAWAVALPTASVAVGAEASASQEGQRAFLPSTPSGAPLLLSDAVRTALDRNLDIIDAEQAVALADKQLSESWSTFYPSLDLTSSYTRNVAPQVSFLPAEIFDPTAETGEFVPVQFGADNIWSLSINAEQYLLEPSVMVGLGVASQYSGLQREALRGRIQQTVTRVRIAFYDLLLAREEARLLEESVERVRLSLKETKAMNEVGLADAYDVLRLEVELANLEPDLRRARNGQVAAVRNLATELDSDPDSELSIAGELAEIDLGDAAANSPGNRDILAFSGAALTGEGDVETLVQGAVGRRSDIRQLQITEDLRLAELRIEQVGYLPTVVAFGNYSVAAQQNGPPDFFANASQRGTTKQVGLRVTLPIFSGFGREARIGQKRAALRQAEARTGFMADQAEAQLRNLADQALEARARASGQALAVSHARRGYEIARLQYREGISSQLELTDAEVALRRSQFNYAQAVYDYLAAGARLDEATGQVPMVDLAATDGARIEERE